MDRDASEAPSARRVKLYQLDDETGQWIDKGTGTVSCSYVEVWYKSRVIDIRFCFKFENGLFHSVLFCFFGFFLYFIFFL